MFFFKEIPLDMLDGPHEVSPAVTEVRMKARGSMKYKRMEENFEEYHWESGMGDEIDAISVDRVEFRQQPKQLTILESIQ